MPVESGLHRVLGFYEALPAVLKRAGLELDAMVVWEDEFEI
jgi:15-cis-phytoene desaturase